MKQLPTVESILGNFMGNFDWTILLGLRNYPRNRNLLVMRSMMIIVITPIRFHEISIQNLNFPKYLRSTNMEWPNCQLEHPKDYKWSQHQCGEGDIIMIMVILTIISRGWYMNMIHDTYIHRSAQKLQSVVMSAVALLEGDFPCVVLSCLYYIC